MPFSDPKWPIVNPDPSVDDCVKAMRWSDYAFAAFATGGSWVYGYLGGNPVRRATAGTAATIGLTFASLVTLQNTRGRFMGYNENAREVKKYGLHPIQPAQLPPQDRRHPTATGMITVRQPLDWQNH